MVRISEGGRIEERDCIEYPTSSGIAHRLIVMAIRNANEYRDTTTLVGDAESLYGQALSIIEAARNGWHHVQPREVAEFMIDDERRVVTHANGSRIRFR